MKITSKGKVFKDQIKYIDDKALLSLIETADALHSDVRQSQTMPFDTGALQNRGGRVVTKGKGKKKKQIKVDGTNLDVDMKSKVVRVVSEAPYARKMYFHPEYNFKKDKNANAGGLWFEPYINGNKKDFVPTTFAKLMRSKMK